MYSEGQGVEQSDSKAREWFGKAAKQGHAHAQCNLALMYEHGKGVEQSDSNAVRWYAKAVAQGDEHAQAAINQILAKKHRRGSSK